MKKLLILFMALLATASMSANSIDLMQGKTLTIGFDFAFDDQAKADEAYVTWELLGDWNLFDYNFSQGTIDEKTGDFTVRALEYKDYLDGIVLSIAGKPKTPKGNYNLSIKVKEASNVDIDKDVIELDLNINYLLPPPPPIWKRLLVPAIILAVLALIVILVLHFTAKFPKGLLQLGRDEVELKGKKIVSIKEELDKLGVELESGTDVVLVKKRFGTYQGPSVKEMRNCVLERDGVYLSKGAVILPDEEIHGLTDIQGNEILIRYC